MSDFDPDAYLATKEPSGFDPDAYLSSKGPADESTADYWREKGDYPEAGAEKPIEQRLAENIQTVGSGAMLPSGIEGVANLGKAAMGGVGKLLNKIPATENIVPTVERVANNQMLKSMGGTMGQLGQMAKGRGGREALDKAAQYALENGLGDVFTTSIGREKQLKALKDASGEAVGALREEAGPAPANIIDRIVDNPKIDPYLGNGSKASGLRGIDRALNDIKEVGGENPTHASLADAATFINKEAAGNKLYQPVTAETDVANILSKENDAGIAQSLGSEKARKYLDALEEQTRLHPLEHLEQRGELREAGGRGGMGRFIQEIADSFGYRLSAKTANAIHKLLTSESNFSGAAKAGGEALKDAAPIALSKDDAIVHYLRKEFDPEYAKAAGL